MTTIDQIKKELRDIIELFDKATPGEWHKECHDNSFENGYAVGGEKHLFVASRLDEKNASFIAASRNLTPKMARALLMAITLFEWGDDAKSLETIRREWEVQA